MTLPAEDHEQQVDVEREYEAWLVRLSQTYASVMHCCRYRLGSPALAERVAVEVIAGLIARPKVWQYFGLPFSGRVAKLTEGSLADAAERGARSPGGLRFDELHDALAALPPPDRARFVEVCIEGRDDVALAVALRCDEEAARRGWEETLARLREIAARATRGESDAAGLD
jgi:DNA-directed RNA polymerase specialized sigma24 family protein